MRIAIIGCSFAAGVYNPVPVKKQIAIDAFAEDYTIDNFKGWPYKLHKKYNVETHLFCHGGDGLFGTRFFIDEIISNYGLDFFDKIIISLTSSEPRRILYKDYTFGIRTSKDNFYYYNILSNLGKDHLPDFINLWQLKAKFDLTKHDARDPLLGAVNYSSSNFAAKEIDHVLDYIETLNINSKFLMFPYGWLNNEEGLPNTCLSLEKLKTLSAFKCYKDQSFSKYITRNYELDDVTVMDNYHHNEKGQKILLDVYLKDILDEFMNERNE